MVLILVNKLFPLPPNFLPSYDTGFTKDDNSLQTFYILYFTFRNTYTTAADLAVLI